MEILADEIMQKVKTRISCSPINNLYEKKINNEGAQANIISRIMINQNDENKKEDKYISFILQKYHQKKDEKFSQRTNRFDSDVKESYFTSNCKKSLSRKKSVQDFTKNLNKNKSGEKLLVRNILKNIFNQREDEQKIENNYKDEFFKEKKKT